MSVQSVKVLGLDMGFENIGWAVLGRTDRWTMIDCGLLVVPASNKKLGVYRSDDDMRRAEIIGLELLAWSTEYEPHLVAFESKANVRSASTSAKLGMGYGALATMIGTHGRASCAMTPQAVKTTLAGSQKATKAEIEEIVKIRVEGHEIVEHTTRYRRHHVYDAIAVALAAESSDVFRATVAGARGSSVCA